MRKLIIAAAAALTLGSVSAAEARPGGCLKYGAGGAIAGHFAGGHRLKGAAIGCAVGYFRRRSAERSYGRGGDVRQYRGGYGRY